MRDGKYDISHLVSKWPYPQLGHDHHVLRKLKNVLIKYMLFNNFLANFKV